MAIISKNKGQEPLIKIPIYLKEVEIGDFKKLAVIDDTKAKKMIQDETQKDKITIINTYWKIISWQESNSLHRASERKDNSETIAVGIDWIRWRDLKIKTCLKKWDAKYDDGEEIPLTPETINAIPSDIAEAMLEKYDKSITVSDDEIKK